jgi:ribonuclease T2
MQRGFTLFLLFTLLLFARYDAPALKACGAYNNLKHTKNTHHVELIPYDTYTVLDEHKGQKLILIKGEQPAQRWVDEACIASKKSMHVSVADSPVAPLSTNEDDHAAQVSKQNLLALSWHNAFCETHRYKKECKRGIRYLFRSRSGDDSFVLHGLWPQPRSRVYCGVPQKWIVLDKRKQWHLLPEPELTEKTKEELSRLMPGYSSNLHRHEWIKHGTCYGTDAEHYFADALALTEAFNHSPVRALFVKKEGKIIDIAELRLLVDRIYGKGTGRKVAMQCKHGLVTELWLNLGGSGNDLATLLRGGKALRSRCKRGRVDPAGFGSR